MQSPEARRQADRFVALHRGARPLVLFHAWNAEHAHSLQQAGAAAVGMTNEVDACPPGIVDGERDAVAEFIASRARVCRACAVPVMVELPGFVTTPDETGILVDRLISRGVAAVTIGGPLDSLSACIASARSAASDADARLFINARLHGSRYDAVLAGARQCLAHGADGVSACALGGYDLVRLCSALEAPVDVDLRDRWGPPIYGLAMAGARRVSIGPGVLGAAGALVRRIAKEPFADHRLHTLLS